ncbi:hypothetical protein ABIC65_001060 [Sphingomonas trueperi]|uniref:hypothetical protein n=1 Tax=Sphingomonas trueperi TaxID=53317 RepID=UPI003394F431
MDVLQILGAVALTCVVVSGIAKGIFALHEAVLGYAEARPTDCDSDWQFGIHTEGL